MTHRACPRGGAPLLAALALALLWSFPYAERTRNANERPRLMQAIALVERGTWRIDGLGLDAGPDAARAPDGALYPNKPPGTSVVAAVGYEAAKLTAGTGGNNAAELSAGTGGNNGAPAEGTSLRAVTWWARLFGGVLPTLVLCGLLWRSLAPSFGARAAALAIVLYALGTPAAAYAHLLYGHQLAACLLWAGLLSLLRAWDGRRPIVAAALGGLLAGSAVLVEYTAAFAGVAAAGLVLAWLRKRAWTTAAAAAAGAMVPMALLMAYHAAAFGGPFKTGYHHSATEAFAAKHGQGLLGLVGPSWHGLEVHLLSLASGLCGWAPLWLPAAWALWSMSRGTWDKEHVPRARLELAAFAAVSLACVSLNFEGGWRVGPRYLMVALPAVTLGWAALAARGLKAPPSGWARTLGLAVLAALGTWSLVVNGLAADLWPHFDLTNINQPVPEVLLPLWRDGFEPYTIAGWLGLRGLGIGWLVLATVIAAAWLAAPAAIGRRGRLAVILGVLLGFGLVGATHALPRHPKGAANLQYIEKVWEPPRSGAPARSEVVRPRGGER